MIVVIASAIITAVSLCITVTTLVMVIKDNKEAELK